MFRISGGFMGDAHCRRLGAGDAATGYQQIKRTHRADQFRQQAGGGWRKNAKLHFRLTEGGIRGDEHKMTGERDF